MNIGERIQQLRETHDLTLEQVGEYVGVKKTTVQRYETGEIDIKRTVAIKLAEILKTNPSYIMGWTDCSAPDGEMYTDIETELIKAYRKASSTDQQIVELTLQKYIVSPCIADAPIQAS